MALRNSAEVCGSVVLRLNGLPQNGAKSLKTLAEVACGTVAGSRGSRTANSLNSKDNSSEVLRNCLPPLQGDAALLEQLASPRKFLGWTGA